SRQGAAGGSPAAELATEVPAATGGEHPPQEYTADLKAIARKAAQAAERETILMMLAHTAGNKREAAERLRISYKAILYKIREYGIGRPRAARKLAPFPIPTKPPPAAEDITSPIPTEPPPAAEDTTSPIPTEPPPAGKDTTPQHAPDPLEV